MISCYRIISLLIFAELILWKINIIHSQVQHCNGSLSSNTLISLLNDAENALFRVKAFAINDIRSNSEKLYSNPMDCAQIYEQNTSSRSGFYEVWPRNRIIKCPVTVYCDMEDEGGAWTVIQRRGDFNSAKDYFFRDWMSYKTGFGDLLKDFWLGNDNIYALTNERDNTVKFILSDWEGNTTYATYDDFWIDSEANNYTSHVSGYRGDAGDSFSFTNGHPFTTKDRDNDGHGSNCAVLFKAAWWYTSCHSSNLNGLYLKGAHESYADGVEWSSFRGQHYSLKDTVIKIRPKNIRKTLGIDITPQ